MKYNINMDNLWHLKYKKRISKGLKLKRVMDIRCIQKNEEYCIYEKNNKIYQLWLDSQGREKIQINKIWNKRDKVDRNHRNTKDKQEYFKRIYATKFTNIEKTDVFLELYNLPRLSHTKTRKYKKTDKQESNWNNHHKPPKNTILELYGFTSNFYQTKII